MRDVVARWRTGRLLAQLGFLAIFPAVLSACSSKEPSAQVYNAWIYFRENAGSRERYLSIEPDGRYESAVLDEHTTRPGMLTDVQLADLQGLVSEGQFDLYLEEAAADCDSASGEIVIQTVRWRQVTDDAVHMRGGCWVRSEVQRPETQTFLDTISDMQLTLIDQ